MWQRYLEYLQPYLEYIKYPVSNVLKLFLLILLLTVCLYGYFIYDWKAPLVYILSLVLGQIGTYIINLFVGKRAFTIYKAPLSHLEISFFNSIKYHGEKLGITIDVKIFIDKIIDGLQDNDDWIIIYEKYNLGVK